jgi:hypothetical protein
MAHHHAHAGDTRTAPAERQHPNDVKECSQLYALAVVAASSLAIGILGFGIHQALSMKNGWVAEASSAISNMQQAQLISAVDQ